ncbi:MAG TPA: peptide-methionine (S)-S-oxide reductase MsrA [Candidatus Binatia bacterium]|nr:peptide-methionine (S)-S-oxide reductase MsrA [Candidatus Binatia bacterium]
MKNRLAAVLLAFAVLAFVAPVAQAAAPPSEQTAVLAGGCFWGMEAVFENLRGVKRAVAGYAGGSKESAHYEIVSSGTTGHAESVQITYDPSVISYRELLNVYFTVAHDPTELNRQGPDEGTQYRSAIFYSSDEQKQVAQTYIRELTQQKKFRNPIVTQVVPLHAFYAAEDYHQHFVQHNPYNPYVATFDLPKLAELRSKFPQLVVSAR